MTTIAVRSGVMAADSMESIEEKALALSCEKIFRKSFGRRGDCLIGTAGESASGLVFVDWFPGVEKTLDRTVPLPAVFADCEADFAVLIVDRAGIWTCDRFCRPTRAVGKFAAIGSGAKAALAAMEMGASARRAVEIACKYDIYSRPPVRTERL